MKVDDRATDRLLRAAAWTYLAPRVAISVTLIMLFGFAALWILLALAEAFLRKLGA
jgi:hypothetical protein